jgi:hypothetical protein
MRPSIPAPRPIAGLVARACPMIAVQAGEPGRSQPGEVARGCCTNDVAEKAPTAARSASEACRELVRRHGVLWRRGRHGGAELRSDGVV